MQSPTAKFLFNDAEYHRKNIENPSSPSIPNVILISENLVGRLENGVIEKEDNEDDRYWAEKLADLDEEHTRRNKLDINETEKLFRSVVNYARRTARARLCSLDHIKVRDCYINNRCQTLQCTTEVENFITCVNKMFFKSVRTDKDLFPSNKKYTYTERFNASVLS